MPILALFPFLCISKKLYCPTWGLPANHATFAFCHDSLNSAESIYRSRSRISESGGVNLLFGQISLKSAWKQRKLDRLGGISKFYYVDPPLVLGKLQCSLHVTGRTCLFCFLLLSQKPTVNWSLGKIKLCS